MTSPAPIRVGFVGAGNVLPAYLQMLDRLSAAGRAVAGPIAVRRPDAQERLLAMRPGAQVADRVEDVLDSDVEVVVVLTPPQPRVGIAAGALRAGKHVLCEKPLGMSRHEVEPLLDMARGLRRHLYLAPFNHLSPVFRTLWTVVKRGELGVVHAARAMYGNLGADWAAWTREAGVGPMAEIGIYNLKSLVLLLGPVPMVTLRVAGLKYWAQVGPLA